MNITWLVFFGQTWEWLLSVPKLKLPVTFNGKHGKEGETQKQNDNEIYIEECLCRWILLQASELLQMFVLFGVSCWRSFSVQPAEPRADFSRTISRGRVTIFYVVIVVVDIFFGWKTTFFRANVFLCLDGGVRGCLRVYVFLLMIGFPFIVIVVKVHHHLAVVGGTFGRDHLQIFVLIVAETLIKSRPICRPNELLRIASFG